MGLQLDSLKKLLVHELKDLHSAESQLLEVLPKVKEACSSSALKESVTDQIKESQGHVERIQEIFQTMKFEPGGHRCRGMEGILTELKEVVSTTDEPEVLDAALVSMLQRVSHYGIAAYGTARTYAEQLGAYDTADMLHDSLCEESARDTDLSRMARRSLNAQAMFAN